MIGPGAGRDALPRVRRCMSRRFFLLLLRGSTAGCWKRHVRWCGRVTVRNRRDPTRSIATASPNQILKPRGLLRRNAVYRPPNDCNSRLPV